MPIAEITVSIPEDIWLAEITSAHPTASFEVISVQSSNDTGTGVLEVESENPVPIISKISDEPDIQNLELLWKRGNEALLQVETENPVLLEPVTQAGVPLRTPFSVSDGKVIWEIVASQAKLSELGARLEALGVTYNVSSIRGLEEQRTVSLLTDRQEEVLLAAFEAGYYDTPREATLTDVAKEVDVTKATCSDILHRAEGKIVSSFISERLNR